MLSDISPLFAGPTRREPRRHSTLPTQSNLEKRGYSEEFIKALSQLPATKIRKKELSQDSFEASTSQSSVPQRSSISQEALNEMDPITRAQRYHDSLKKEVKHSTSSASTLNKAQTPLPSRRVTLPDESTLQVLAQAPNLELEARKQRYLDKYTTPFKLGRPSYNSDQWKNHLRELHLVEQLKKEAEAAISQPQPSSSILQKKP